MEHSFGMDSEPIDKSRVLDIKPLRCVPPISSFPPFGSQASYPSPPPFPSNGTPTQFYPPFFNFSQPPNQHASGSQAVGFDQNKNPTQTPSQPEDDRNFVSKRNSISPLRNVNKSNSSVSVSEGNGIDGEASSNGKKQKSKNRTKKVKMSVEEKVNSQDGDSVSVASVLMKYNALRRRFSQLEEAGLGGGKRSDLKAGTIMMSSAFRTNMRKRIGIVPGVEVGDIFFYRIELCLVGLHSQSMAGIDYMVVKCDQGEEPRAVSVVSSGGYEDDVDNGDVLIYSGQGGNICNTGSNGKEAADQKLERGNLALERSLHHANEVRVIRGIKDIGNPSGKVYVYDGLYVIQESWVEKSKAGSSVFKYKFIRVPGQPEAFTIWKATQQWRENVNFRHGLILPDLSSGKEKLPVPLVNDMDGERDPAYFVYYPGLNYSKPINSAGVSIGCSCKKSCVSNTSCSCIQKNGGDAPYSNGLLVIQKPLVHECGPSCSCYPNCKNQVSQNGPKVHLEVFKTKDKGWGLRSWDPIRAGAFICEYAGEVIYKDEGGRIDIGNEYIFNATHTGDYSSEWNYIPELAGEDRPMHLNEAYKQPVSITINAKNMGNVARFMNHSCSPNVFWQIVYNEQNEDSCPHIMFYAIRHIPPMTELTYDYGVSGRRKQCLCGSAKCRSFFG